MVEVGMKRGASNKIEAQAEFEIEKTLR